MLLCSNHGDLDEDDDEDEDDKEDVKLTEEVEVELTLCVTLLYPRRLDMREGRRAFGVGAVLVVRLVFATVIIIRPSDYDGLRIVMEMVIIWNMVNGEHLLLTLFL